MIFEFASHPDNFLLRLTDEGFSTHSDLVFRYEGVQARGRYVVPASWNIGRKVKVRRARAKAIREYMRYHGFCRLDIAEAYNAAIRLDGAKVLPWDRFGLMLLRVLK